MSHNVHLTWAPGANDVSFNVYRSQVSGGEQGANGTKLTVNPISFNPGASPAFDDPNVETGQTYFYVVTGLDSTGVESSPSNEAKAVIPGPGAPTTLAASAT